MTTSPSGTCITECTRSTIAFCLFCVVAATVVLVDICARSKPLALWMDGERQGRVRAAQITYRHKGFYESMEDQVMLDFLPSGDYSQGSVCLVGASTLAVATRIWDLPPGEQALIHNFGTPETCHTMHFQMLEYLTDHRDLLRAGPENTLIVIAVTYHCGLCKNGPRDPFVASATKYGHYAYDQDRGLQPGPARPVLRWIQTEKSRIPGFLRMSRELAIAHVKLAFNIDPGPLRRRHDPIVYNDRMRRKMGESWIKNQDDQIAAFDRMSDYVLERKIHLAVVLLPLASWDDELPFEARYNARMTALCQAKGVPLYDWSGMLGDDEFGDGNHANISGMEKLHAALMGLAFAHLQRKAKQ